MKESLDGVALHAGEPELFQDDRCSRFKLDLYDWDHEEFEPKYCILPLSAGYFTIIDRRDYGWASKYKWSANVQRDRVTRKVVKVYAIRNEVIPGKKKKTGVTLRRYVYLHREVAGAGRKIIVDHRNGFSLDNRRCNLYMVDSQSENGGSSSNKIRPKFPHLPRGVEPIFKKLKGGRTSTIIGYIGVIWVNYDRERSERFETPEEASSWYVQKHKEYFTHRPWLTEFKGRQVPEFPPLIHKPLPELVRQLESDIPF